MSDSLKRAKAKYYQKIKDDPNYKEKIAQNSKRYYEENKEKQIEKLKKYYNENKDIISEKNKEKRNKNKLNDVSIKLDLIDKGGNTYLGNKECQNTTDKLKNEIKEHINNFKNK